MQSLLYLHHIPPQKNPYGSRQTTKSSNWSSQSALEAVEEAKGEKMETSRGSQCVEALENDSYLSYESCDC